jgi:general secretion pathway protein G
MAIVRISSKSVNPAARRLSLQELVEKGYLRELPLDPITGSRETWVPVPEDQPLSVEGKAGVKDVKSGAEGLSSEGTPYSEW